MKRTYYTLAAILTLCLAGGSLFGAGIEVPDLETRIRNSGGEVPATALPELPNPLPTPIPTVETAVSATPEASSVVPSPEPEMPLVPESTDGEKAPEGSLSGWVSLGAGSPGTLSGDLAVNRAGGTLPRLALRFSYDAADGFGGENTGEGYFDRSISLGTKASAERWNAEISLSERTDGLQGMNADLYSLTARDVRWNAGVDVPVSSKVDLFAVFGITGAVYTSFADRPGTALSAVSPSAPTVGEPIVETGGYRLEPSLALTLDRGRGHFAVEGAYGYETLVGTGSARSGEVNTGKIGLSAAGDFGRLTLASRAGVALDGNSGTAFPFGLSAEWKDDRGAVRLLSVSGGLDAYRSGVETLAEKDPFVSRNLLSRTAADWFALLALDLAGPSLKGAATGLNGRAAWRDTAFAFGLLDKGALAVPDAGASAGLVPVEERERQSLATELGLSAASSSAKLTAGWNAEWLDSASSEASQRLSARLSLFDSGERRLWETEASFDLPLTESSVGMELPYLNLSASLRPARAFTLTLAFTDIVPLAAGEPRARNAVYADRSGVLTLSGRIDF